MSIADPRMTPLPNFGLPVTAVPVTSDVILNDEVGADPPVKVISGSATPRSDRGRLVTIHLPTAGRQLAYTTVARGATAPTAAQLTATIAGADTNGVPVFPNVLAEFVIDEGSDLYLVASAAGTEFALSVRTVML